MLHKRIIRPVLNHGSETWTWTKSQTERLAIFERKVLRYILGVVNENVLGRQRHNFELYKLFKEADVIKSIKIGCLRFTGHICRMDLSSLAFKIFNYKPIGTRTRGRPKLRWADCVEDDFKVLKVTNWRTIAKRRSE
ncbi:endonuclease-reverse transcriptase [Trichonephila clavipes]|nr:endonuclease-reverse transcriptase [Trichonephila clavipes]